MPVVELETPAIEWHGGQGPVVFGPVAETPDDLEESKVVKFDNRSNYPETQQSFPLTVKSTPKNHSKRTAVNNDDAESGVSIPD